MCVTHSVSNCHFQLIFWAAAAAAASGGSLKVASAASSKVLPFISEMKGIVAGLSTAFCYFFIFLSAFTFPFMNQWQLWNGPVGTFLFYAIIAAFGLVFVYFAPLRSESKCQENRYYRESKIKSKFWEGINSYV